MRLALPPEVLDLSERIAENTSDFLLSLRERESLRQFGCALLNLAQTPRGVRIQSDSAFLVVDTGEDGPLAFGTPLDVRFRRFKISRSPQKPIDFSPRGIWLSTGTELPLNICGKIYQGCSTYFPVQTDTQMFCEDYGALFSASMRPFLPTVSSGSV